MEEKRAKKVDGATIQTKKGNKFVDQLVPNRDVEGIGEILLYKVLIPAAKKAVLDGISMMLNGGSESYRGPRNSYQSGFGSSSPYVSYNSRYGNNYGSPNQSRITRCDYRSIEIPCQSYQKADEVKRELRSIVDQYRMVRVADVYEMCDQTPKPIDYRWGWFNLDGMRTESGYDGYSVVLPRPVEIEN